MAGLVGYASSDEDEEVEQPQQIQPVDKKPSSEAAAASEPQPPVDGSARNDPSEPAQAQKDAPSTEEKGKVTIGPILQNATPLGPSLPQVGDSYPGPENDALDEAPGSPYSANRAALHDLTLPSIPNMDIPPSPPGSPTETTNKKFEQFIQLKKKGVHFNAKLETSVALKNPSLVDKLMAFVDMDEKSQYDTTLPADLWNPKGFPDWAYRDSLKKSQDKIARERESEKGSGTRTAVEFVPAVGLGAGNSSAGLASRRRLFRISDTTQKIAWITFGWRVKRGASYQSEYIGHLEKLLFDKLDSVAGNEDIQSIMREAFTDAFKEAATKEAINGERMLGIMKKAVANAIIETMRRHRKQGQPGELKFIRPDVKLLESVTGTC